MTAPNGNGHGQVQMQAIPLLAFIPMGVQAPQFHCVAQWHTGSGIICQPAPVPVQPMLPAAIVQMFVNLVNSGFIGMQVQDEEGHPVVVDFPNMQLTLREPPPRAPAAEGETVEEEAKPPSRIILPGG